jgi:hypothetical protein
MKKNICLALFATFVLLFNSKSGFSQIKTTTKENPINEFVQFVSKSKIKSFYEIKVNEIQNDAERAAFIEGLYASSKVVVVSRTDENGILKVTALNTFSNVQVKQEINSILVSSKAKQSSNVLKNK